MRLPPPVSFDPLSLDLLAQSRESIAARRHAEIMQRHGGDPRGPRAEQRGLQGSSGSRSGPICARRFTSRTSSTPSRNRSSAPSARSRPCTPTARAGRWTSVTDELGAVVCGTEAATNSILAAAEEIDEITGELASQLSGPDAEMARQISDRVITIFFEACNFQDITGQRISKVVGSMKFIEERMTQMAQIWGGLESFNDVEAFQMPEREGDEALLNGPAMDGDPNRTSQDAIDALFGSSSGSTSAATESRPRAGFFRSNLIDRGRCPAGRDACRPERLDRTARLRLVARLRDSAHERESTGFETQSDRD